MSRVLSFLVRGALFLVIVVAGACSDSDGPTTAVPCAEMVKMTVTLPNNIPRFDWTPRCGVSSLQVASGPSSEGFGSWEIDADGPTILPPIMLNVVPTGVRSKGPMNLRSGHQYGVYLFVNTPGRPASWFGSSGWTQP